MASKQLFSKKLQQTSQRLRPKTPSVMRSSYTSVLQFRHFRFLTFGFSPLPIAKSCLSAKQAMASDLSFCNTFASQKVHFRKNLMASLHVVLPSPQSKILATPLSPFQITFVNCGNKDKQPARSLANISTWKIKVSSTYDIKGQRRKSAICANIFVLRK